VSSAIQNKLVVMRRDADVTATVSVNNTTAPTRVASPRINEIEASKYTWLGVLLTRSQEPESDTSPTPCWPHREKGSPARYSRWAIGRLPSWLAIDSVTAA
jgi:hypothetical protein